MTDTSPQRIPDKIINTIHNVKDWGIGIFIQASKWGNIIILNQDGVEKAVADIEEHNVWYSFRNDKHRGCCKPAECYINKVCVDSCIEDCSKTEGDLIRYYA